MAEWSIARACKALPSSVQIRLVPPILTTPDSTYPTHNIFFFKNNFMLKNILFLIGLKWRISKDDFCKLSTIWIILFICLQLLIVYIVKNFISSNDFITWPDLFLQIRWIFLPILILFWTGYAITVKRLHDLWRSSFDHIFTLDINKKLEIFLKNWNVWSNEYWEITKIF